MINVFVLVFVVICFFFFYVAMKMILYIKSISIPRTPWKNRSTLKLDLKWAIHRYIYNYVLIHVIYYDIVINNDLCI